MASVALGTAGHLLHETVRPCAPTAGCGIERGEPLLHRSAPESHADSAPDELGDRRSGAAALDQQICVLSVVERDLQSMTHDITLHRLMSLAGRHDRK